MEILKDEAVEKTEAAKEIPAEDFTKQMTDAFEKAEGIAQKIKETMIGGWFTKMKLATYQKRQVNQVDQDLRFISQFFLLEQEERLGVIHFHIITEKKERLEFIKSNKQMQLAQIQQWDLIAQLISGKEDADDNSKGL